MMTRLSRWGLVSISRGESSVERLRLLAALALLFCVLVPTCACDSEPTAFEFPLADQHGIDEARLAEAYTSAQRSHTINSLLVERHGVLVAEGYFRGYVADSLNRVWSVTKSFTSALIGIAIDEGYIESVDQTLADYLGSVVDELDPEKGAITIRHLLTMSSGLPWIEEGEDSEYTDWVSAPDQVEYILEKPLVYEPGTQFDYSDGSAHLVSVVLSEATGTTALDFARQHLFEPLGFGPTEWWVDNRGYNFGGVGLGIRSRDMIRFGRLYLDGGAFGTSQIIPSEWVGASTQTQISPNLSNPDAWRYGYFWWLGDCGTHDCFWASGYAGQLIVVVPGLELVVVATSPWDGGRLRAMDTWAFAFNLIMSEVLPAVR